MDEKINYTSQVENVERNELELTESGSGGAQAIDKGNEAVLLDISAAGISKIHAHVKLAKDGHVRTLSDL